VPLPLTCSLAGTSCCHSTYNTPWASFLRGAQQRQVPPLRRVHFTHFYSVFLPCRAPFSPGIYPPPPPVTRDGIYERVRICLLLVVCRTTTSPRSRPSSEEGCLQEAAARKQWSSPSARALRLLLRLGPLHHQLATLRQASPRSPPQPPVTSLVSWEQSVTTHGDASRACFGRSSSDVSWQGE